MNGYLAALSKEAMTVTEIEALQAEIKKLSARATTMKMNLHDLAEELPINWQNIVSVAQATFDAFAKLETARATFKATKSGTN